jgi:transketolase
MRTAFFDAILEAAARDPRVMLVVGDLGFGAVAEFASRLPRQFLNIGVAEQNMTGVAAGLAHSGKVVFTYSIANFPTLRCLEQIRNDVCYHNANVVIVAVGGGLAYGSLGMSHHATEDLAILRALPEMKVIAPGDARETQAATAAAARGIGPVYLRIGRDGEPDVHQDDISWTLGRANTVRPGRHLTLISTGSMLHTAVTAANLLDAHGLQARVLSMHTLKPLDREGILAAAAETHNIYTLEEHSILGGLGGAVAEVLCESDIPGVRFRRIGLESAFATEVGDQNHLRKVYGLDPESIARRILAEMQSVPSPANGSADRASLLNHVTTPVLMDSGEQER